MNTQHTAGTARMALGDLVRWRRKQLALTQEEIAGRDPLGKLTQAEISQYERKEVGRSSVKKLERLAVALDLPYDLIAAATVQRDADDSQMEAFVRRWYAANDHAEQLPLASSSVSHEQVLADLFALAQSRPDLLRALRELREQNTEEVYRQGVAIIWRSMISGVEIARDLLATSSKTSSSPPE